MIVRVKAGLSWLICFVEALMKSSRRNLSGRRARSFTHLKACWTVLKTGLQWDCQLERLQVASPWGGLKVVRLITGQLRALGKSIPANREKAPWFFKIPPQKSYFVTSAVPSWSKHVQPPPLPPVSQA